MGSEISPNIDKKINLEMDSEIGPTDEKTGLKLTQKSAMQTVNQLGNELRHRLCSYKIGLEMSSEIGTADTISAKK